MKHADDTALKRIEKILIRIFIGLGIVVVAAILLLLRLDRGGADVNRKPAEQEESQVWEDGLSDSTIWLPTECALYESMPEFPFTDSQGKEFQISNFFGKPLVVVFWASWCEDCQEQMPHMKDYMDIAAEYGEVQFLLINRLDGEKETRETAETYFANLGVNTALYYDEGGIAFNRLGMQNIPTTYFIDANGILVDWSSSQMVTEGEFESYLQNLMLQKSRVTENFITEQLMDEEGGIHSTYSADILQSDVLSESQGLMLQYAAKDGNRELFDRTLGYVNTYMSGEGLTAWTVTDKNASNVNALLDDLRIYGALELAQEQWGEYEEALESFRQKLLEYGMENGSYIDFYDSKLKKKAQRLTLCYIDLLTMEKLAAAGEEFATAYEAALDLLAGGQISQEFPLYYGWYDYKEDSYEAEELNAAEAMVTLLHLAQADRLPEVTLSWLKEQMARGGVKARYDVDGNIVSGYNYDSTAVYAIIAMIGVTVEDEELTAQAVNKMEKMRIRDAELAYNGAFGLEDGSGISSFDQLIPLQAYQLLENKADAE